MAATALKGETTTSGRRTTMNDEFKQGDEVVWSSHGKDHTPGVVVRKIVTYTLERR